MKKTFRNILIASLFSGLLVSCSNDDDTQQETIEGFGDAELFFDNGMAGDALILGGSKTNSNNETLTVNRLNYIISNVVLIEEDGTEYVYPKNESYFIISQEGDMHTVHLENIPAGDYTQVRFGIGVDELRYLEGETAQQEFWDYAAANNMTWTWSTGYRFINFEGTFTSENNSEPLQFQVHQGSNSATDNYREVTLNLPTTARVRVDEMPNIHIIADANTIVDGTNKIVLSENLNTAGTNASIMGGENLILIAENTQQMFTVDHVHNGGGSHQH
ncbi:MbnP family protein [Aequorivita echinoideorum]|uniref:Copper-binding protein MbnP-like domain-containing protein n=1 Tax=Aequorivita echinoideorum TaxID=1549647 RepID=A0ABS5S5V3_9FLAO|nr:MbnP family protein [Aequorivita echinoideorum]MBT0608358.1 hypothetical protein [Aequorivita echinoideorum]